MKTGTWKVFRDETLMTGLAGLSALGAAIVAITLVKDARQPDYLTSPYAWPALLILFAVFWQGAQLFRHLAIWPAYREAVETKPLDRSPRQKVLVERGYREFFLYLALSLSGLGLIAYLAAGSGRIGAVELGISAAQPDPVDIGVFLGFFAAAFLPLALIICRHAGLDARTRQRDGQAAEILRSDVVSDVSFWTTAVLVAGIVGLAWAAAGDMFSMKKDFGVFITFIVLLVFFVIILTPHVLRFLNDYRERQEEKVLSGAGTVRIAGAAVSLPSPGKWVSRLDSVLVRFIAPLSGATQNGPFVPHLLVLLVILPLSALGYVLAAPWGLIPIGLAMLIALALGRRWAWVEDDRETASRLRTTRGRKIAIGFQNDLKDEALLGYASLFILVPLALAQLQGWTGSFDYRAEYSSNNAFVDWLRFFGAELAKAVPFVDWWEIYNVDIETPYSADLSDNQLAKHLTFAARAMVDLVIMAALFQAIGLWQRSRIQHSLYKSGQVDAFDPFTEVSFFENGMIRSPGEKLARPKKKFVERVEEHVEQRRQLKLSETPYSQERLSELINSPNPDVSSGARWMIRRFKVLAGTPREQLEQIAERLANEAAEALHHANEDRAYARLYKNELERILQELIDDYRSFQAGDVRSLVSVLMSVQGVPEFSYAQLLAVELLMMRPSRRAYMALAMLVLEDRHFDAPLGKRYKGQFATYFDAYNSTYLEQLKMRNDVYSAMEFHASSLLKQEALFNDILELLEWMSTRDDEDAARHGDKSKASREFAYACADRLRRLRVAAGFLGA